MSGELISKYQAAFVSLDTAKKQAKQYVEIITDAARKLMGWEWITVNDTDPQIEFPLNMSHSQSIIASKWPTGQQLAQALAEYHSALSMAINAWKAIPQASRIGIQPPPSHRQI